MSAFLTSVSYDRWILPALLVIPLLGVVAVWIHGRLAKGAADDPRQADIVRWITFATLLIEFIVSAGLWWAYDPGAQLIQQRVSWRWIPSWGVRFSVGADGFAVMMVLLTTFLMPLSVLGGWSGVRAKVHWYHALLLILTSGMIGVFIARDLFLFYVMWEVMLVPMYFIIGIWGGERRIYASLKFFIYTMLGSLLMLVAIVYLGVKAANPALMIPNFSFDALLVSPPALSTTASMWLFLAFFLAFAVKVPMFPFHTWLPDAHTEAPTAGSVILAAILLKMGTFGFLRFALPLFPAAAMHPTVRSVILALAVIGVIYGALVAMVQPDFKRLVAYSSVSHLGFVMLGIFALTVESVQGALMVMINHGISTGALFFLVGMLYERKHSRMIEAYGGIARTVPMFAAVLTFVALSSIGVPGTNGFVGEFLVLVGSFKTAPLATALATTGVIFAAAYLLWAIQRVLFNPLDKPENAKLTDLNWREVGLLTPLLVVIVWLGLFPGPVLRRMEPAARQLVEYVHARAGESKTVGMAR